MPIEVAVNEDRLHPRDQWKIPVNLATPEAVNKQPVAYPRTVSLGFLIHSQWFLVIDTIRS